jgi:hypothetical protein
MPRATRHITITRIMAIGLSVWVAGAACGHLPRAEKCPRADIATFAISGKGSAYPSPSVHTPRGGTGVNFPGDNFCIWPRAQPRCQPPRVSH